MSDPPTGNANPRERLHAVYRSTRRAWASIQRDRVPQMAAALTFRTIFSLVPVSVIAVLVLQVTASGDVANDIAAWLVEFVGLDRFDAPPEGADGAATEAQGEDAGSELASIIRDVIAQASSVNFGAIGGVGVLLLIYAAISLMSEIETSFNLLYRAEKGRSWGRRIQRYWFFLTLGPVLLWATFWVSDRFGALTVGPLLGFGVTLAIAWLLLLLAYTALPNTRVHLRAALAGSFVAAFCWQISKVVFTSYVGQATTTFTLYGSLGLLPIFLLWVYFTWVIALFGLKITYTMHHFARLIDEPLEDELRLIDPTAGVALMLDLARAYKSAEAPTAVELAERAELDDEVVTFLLGHLTEQGLVRRVDRSGDADGFVPASPPDEIQAASVLGVVRQTTLPWRRGPGAGTQERLWDSLEQGVRGKTLRNLLDLADESPALANGRPTP